MLTGQAGNTTWEGGQQRDFETGAREEKSSVLVALHFWLPKNRKMKLKLGFFYSGYFFFFFSYVWTLDLYAVASTLAAFTSG